MTIKQHGGVFGRNPTFNEVNVEGGLSIDGSTYTNFKENGSDIGSVFVTDDKIGIGTLNNGIAFDQSSNIILPFNPQTLLKRDGELDLGYAAGKFKNLYLSGNVIVDNGKGIDFSATSGTGTSELFDDYEEGTWTPTIGGSSSAGTYTYSIQDGHYTKIGNQVTAWFNIRVSGITSAGSGTLLVKGLPFSVNSSFSGGANFLGIDGLANDRRTAGLLPSAGNNYAVAIRGYGGTGSGLGLPITDLDGDGGEDILATLIYWV